MPHRSSVINAGATPSDCHPKTKDTFSTKFSPKSARALFSVIKCSLLIKTLKRRQKPLAPRRRNIEMNKYLYFFSTKSGTKSLFLSDKLPWTSLRLTSALTCDRCYFLTYRFVITSSDVGGYLHHGQFEKILCFANPL